MHGRHRRPLRERIERQLLSGPDWWAGIKCQVAVTALIMCVPFSAFLLGCLVWLAEHA